MRSLARISRPNPSLLPPADSPLQSDDQGLIRRLLLGEPLPRLHLEDFERLIELLRSHRDGLVARSLIEESEVADSALRRARELYGEELKNDFQRTQRAGARQRLLQAEGEFALLKESVRAQTAAFAESLDRQLQHLEDQQREELREFASKWRGPAKVRHYNRTSPALRDLRTRQLRSLQSQEYEIMRRVRQEANDLEQHETAEMRRLLFVDYAMALQQLQGRHIDQITKLRSIHDQKVATFEKGRMREFSTMENRIAKLRRAYELTCDREAVWNVLGHNQPDDRVSRPVRASSRQSELWTDGLLPDEFAFLKLDPVPRPLSVRREVRPIRRR
jgi:hypothetical protein